VGARKEITDERMQQDRARAIRGSKNAYEEENAIGERERETYELERERLMSWRGKDL